MSESRTDTGTKNAAGDAARMEWLLVHIMTAAACTTGAEDVQHTKKLTEPRRMAILRFFQRNMRYSTARVAAVQVLVQEALEQPEELVPLLEEFRSRVDRDPDLERVAYNSRLLLTLAIYQILHSGGRPTSAELTQVRVIASKLGIFSDDLRTVEAKCGIAAPQEKEAASGSNRPNQDCNKTALRSRSSPECFEKLYISIMVRVGLLDGHFTRAKLRIILEFFQSNMLYSGARLRKVAHRARRDWTAACEAGSETLPAALNQLADEFHQNFNYATRRMLLDHVFQLVYSKPTPSAKEKRAAQEIGAALRIFSEDFHGLEEKYLRQREARRLAREEEERRREERIREKERERQEKAKQEHPHRQNGQRNGYQRKNAGNSTGWQSRQERSPKVAAPLGEAGCYAILKLRPGAPFQEIKKAWHELVLEYHPDRLAHLGPEFVALAEQRMKEINEAYSFFAEKNR